MEIENYFDEETMSVHLREGALAVAKKGVPGKWKMVPASKEKIEREKVKEMAEEILEEVKEREKSFLEIEREGSSIIQLGEYRIVIVRPPFSDGWEITAVRPVAKLSLEDYKLSKELKERLTGKVEGVLIAGSPGEGKTTLARALAEHYASLGRVVKTVESPRDMLLSDEITQYSLTYGERDEIHDVLLLSRPDNTIFDEMRNTDDFKLFADLRLAGIGMVGVLHATNPVEAIQRFIGRIEMGVIPQVVDTVVFVSGGKVDKVLGLKMKVKVPSGMVEADLARPVVEVSDFFSGKLEFEIYTYGEQTVVMPVSKAENAVDKLVEEGIRQKLKKYANQLEVEVVSGNRVIVYVPEQVIPKMIGRGGKEIEKIEKEIGLSIDVRELKVERGGEEVSFEVEARKNLLFYLDKGLVNREIDIYSGEEFLISTHCSRKGMVKISLRSEVGKRVLSAVKKGTVRLRLVK